MTEKKEEKVKFSRILLTCSNCKYFPLVIDNIYYYPHTEEYSITTRCPKCHDIRFKHVPKEIFEKLDLENL